MLQLLFQRSKLIFFLIILHGEVEYCKTSTKQDTTIAQEALEYVSAVESRTSCNDGTSNTLNLQFDTSVWSIYTEPAIRTANLLTDILITNNGTLDSLSDDMFFTLVRNNIRGASVIFGSAIAIELGVYGKYPKFSPYAYEKNGTIFSHDIAINYDYLNGETEWYEAVKIKTWDGVHFAADEINYRSGNVLLPMEIVSRPTAVLSDGHWTKPYYDCGGGDIWMVTYSSPIFDINDTTNEAEFRGVATIDIELTNIDINQCEPDETSSGALDIFRGTHKCQPTTTCVFTAGLGFTRGAYNCHCQNGYYHPSTTHQYFLGMTVENHYANRSLEDGMFQCLRCAPGCTTCVDSSPCLFETNVVLRSILLIMAILTLVGIVLTSVMTYYYRETKVIKSGSTSFLQLMCLGSALMCTQLFLMFPDASEVLCSIIPWFFHTGFCLMYVALLLKTWRISVIFRVGTFKRVHLPDKVVLQRMLPAVGIMTAYLVAWTATDTERTITLTTSDDKLKFKICSASWWYYAIHGGEALLLLFGVYLCFTVRKAPANFNESKYITWSVYNAIILGSFILIITRFVLSSGPDLVYVLSFLQIQVVVTITMSLIFVPKFYTLLRKKDYDNTRKDSLPTIAQSSIGGRFKHLPTTNMSTVRGRGCKSVAVQVPDFSENTLKVPSRVKSGRKLSSKVSPMEPEISPASPP